MSNINLSFPIEINRISELEIIESTVDTIYYQIMSFAAEVKKELIEMQRMGITITEEALQQCTPENLKEYENMKVSDCADLLIDLYC